MNLKKILWAFFYTFLVLDCVLCYQWFMVNRPLSDPGSSQNVRKEMQMDGIKYGKLSQEPVSGAYISGDEDDSLYGERYRLDSNLTAAKSGNAIVVTPKKPIHLGNNRQQAIKKLKEMANDPNVVIDGKAYAYDEFLSNYLRQKNTNADGSSNVVFNQKATVDGSKKLFSSHRGRIQFTIDQNFYLKNYTQTRITHLEKLRDISSLITEEDALINAYQYNEIPNNSEVQASQLSYMMLNVVRGDVIYVPVWSFVVKNNANEVSIVTINAMNGALMH